MDLSTISTANLEHLQMEIAAELQERNIMSDNGSGDNDPGSAI